MRRLRFPLRSALRDDPEDVALHRIWQEIDSRFPRRAARRRLPAPIVAILSAGAVALVLVVVGRGRGTDAGPLRLADGRPVAAVDGSGAAASRAIVLADGSRIELGEDARLEPLETSGSTFSAVVARGRAAFDVRPGGPRRWTIECGLATVEVVGTRFACDRQPGRLRVTVDHGSVLVRGERVPDRVRRLGAGDAIEIVDAADGPPPATTTTPAPAQAPRMPAPSATREPAAAVPPSAPPHHGGAVAVPLGPNRWRDLARDGRHREAFRSLGEEGLRREARRLGVQDLLVLADVARLSGHPGDAVGPLQRILVEFGGDPQAPLAAFALGRLELDALAQPSRAKDAFERAIALGVPASLKEDARARLVEACARAGDQPAAAAAAAAYAHEFPKGRYARAIEGWLSSQ